MFIKQSKKVSACLLVSSLMVLSGCATMSQSECQVGDWYSKGIEDGSNGRQGMYLSNHAKACSKYGVTVNRPSWEKGRQEGLRYYCTKSKAYSIGEKGASLSPVCGFLSRSELNELQRLNQEGKRLYNAKSALRSIENKIDDMKDDIEEKKKKLLNDRDLSYRQRLALQNEIDLLREKILLQEKELSFQQGRIDSLQKTVF